MPVSGVYQIHPPGPLHLFLHGITPYLYIILYNILFTAIPGRMMMGNIPPSISLLFYIFALLYLCSSITLLFYIFALLCLCSSMSLLFYIFALLYCTVFYVVYIFRSFTQLFTYIYWFSQQAFSLLDGMWLVFTAIGCLNDKYTIFINYNILLNIWVHFSLQSLEDKLLCLRNFFRNFLTLTNSLFW